MVNLNSAQGRLSAMLFLTTTFFLIEIVVGYITNSMALIADSFHMFSDAIALVIAFISVRMSPKKWSKNTFGWARAEILGALINAVFLCALCVSILIESIKRFLNPDPLHEPGLVFVVGALGLFINLIGLLLFRGHHHHHHGHHHGHHHNHEHNHSLSPAKKNAEFFACDGNDLKRNRIDQADKLNYGLLCKNGGSHTGGQDLLCNRTANHLHTPSLDIVDNSDEKHQTRPRSPRKDRIESFRKSSSGLRHTKVNMTSSSQESLKSNHDVQSSASRQGSPDKEHEDYAGDSRITKLDNHCHSPHIDVKDDDQAKPKRHATSNQMNMHGVFLHVMADALGSVIVMISAIVTLKTDWTIRLYIDPILSVIMVCLILRSTWPLLTESAMILLQTVPTHIEVDSLRRRLTQEIPGVLAVHEFHVWQLAGDRIIASAHIRCHNLQDYMRIAEKVKEFFHNEGIHSTTIQPEFIDLENAIYDNGTSDDCADGCPPAQGVVLRPSNSRKLTERPDTLRLRMMASHVYTQISNKLSANSDL